MILGSREGSEDRPARHDAGMALDGNPLVMMAWPRLGPNAARSGDTLGRVLGRRTLL